MLDKVINKVHVFGLHFASLDVRQESSVHNKVLEAVAEKEKLLPANYSQLTNDQKIDALVNASGRSNPDLYTDELIKDTLLSASTIKGIQQFNGEAGCNRYIISQCNSALNVLEVFGLLLLNGWKKEKLLVDIVPLFETIEDLKQAPAIMKTLYTNKNYRQH